MILAQLRELGADLAEPRHVVHYLYFGDEPSARRAGDQCSAASWEATVTAPDDVIAQWSLRAESHRIVDDTTVDSTRAWFEQLAAECGGEYDGWEAAANP
jgi:hypothetical protein